ncbi:hypothetical protein [Chamaesiphon sp.]|uniref:hypothetical protein n=1 Tax=Chamaesiphon sp. TaxID=2814140 RepID=UPI003593D45D
MSQALVGTKTLDSIEELRDLLAQFDPKRCYFGRWAHKVSGLVKSLDLVLPSPEGQMFCIECELRWKQNSRQGYEVLLLHCDRSVIKLGFEPVGNGWLVSAPFPAHQYDSDETRFPQGFHAAEKMNLQQRYFRDAATDTVHFVAITLAH